MNSQSWRVWVTFVATFALLIPLAAGAETTPTWFSSGQNEDASAYTLRVYGENRFSTAGALGVMAAVGGDDDSGWPFNTPDMENASSGYGFPDSCPGNVVVAAGDTPADALAASPVREHYDAFDSDITGGDDDLLFLTDSGRQGATDLHPDALRALQAIRAACGVFDAVILGGTQAVPTGAESTLDSIAADVVRINGTNRWDTARILATTVFNSLGGTTASLPDVTFWTNASTMTTLDNAVILAEGFTGADALAIGSLAAFQSIPVVITPSDTLPTETRNALIQMSPDNLIVMGGTVAISDDVASAAASAAGGATITRVAGADRYETSVLVSQHLFGLWPANAGGSAFSDQPFAFARSEGSGDAHQGWPDALALPYYLANFFDDADTPERMAPTIEANQTGQTIGGAGNNEAPILLLRQDAVPASVDTLLAGLYPDSTDMVTGANPAPATPNDGGFGFVAGGPAAIADAVVLTLAENLSGGTYTSANQGDLAPTMDAGVAFFSNADLSGYVHATEGGVDDASPATGEKVCVLRNGLTGSQWLAGYENSDFLSGTAVDYQDASTSHPASQSRITCVAVSGGSADDVAAVFGISLSGHQTAMGSFDWSSNSVLLSTDTPGTDGAPDSVTTGFDPALAVTTAGASTSGNMNWSDGAITVSHQGTTFPPGLFDLSLSLTRTDGEGAGDDADRLTFTGTLTVKQSNGTVIFTAGIVGEAVGSDPGAAGADILLVGMYEIGGIGSGGAKGSFNVNIVQATPLDPTTYTLANLVVDGNA